MFISEQPYPNTPVVDEVTFTINWADRPQNRLAAMQFGNPRVLKLMENITVSGASIHAVVQELHKSLQRYSLNTSGHWYRMPGRLLLEFIANAVREIAQNPTNPHFSVREDNAPAATPKASPVNSRPKKVTEPWVEVTRGRKHVASTNNRFAGLDSQPNNKPYGKLKVSKDGVLSIGAVAIPKSPPPQQLLVAATQDRELKSIVTFEVPNVPSVAAPSIYDLF